MVYDNMFLTSIMYTSGDQSEISVVLVVLLGMQLVSCSKHLWYIVPVVSTGLVSLLDSHV